MKGYGNINDPVWLKLTSYGQTVLRDWIENIPVPSSWTSADREVVIKMHDAGEGWSEFQIWELMQIFGPKMDHGAEQMFEDNAIYYTHPLRV